MSPPSPTRTPHPSASWIRSAARSAASALAVAPRSTRIPRGIRATPVFRFSSIRRHPGTGAAPRGPAYRSAPARRSRGRSRAPAMAEPTVGSTSPSVVAAASSPAASACANSGLSRTSAPSAVIHPRQLGVRPEPAAGHVDRRQFLVEDRRAAANWPASVTTIRTRVPNASKSAAAVRPLDARRRHQEPPEVASELDEDDDPPDPPPDRFSGAVSELPDPEPDPTEVRSVPRPPDFVGFVSRRAPSRSRVRREPRRPHRPRPPARRLPPSVAVSRAAWPIGSLSCLRCPSAA